MRHEHIFRIECFIKFFLCHKFFLKHNVVDRTVGFKGFLSYLRTVLVANVRIQCRNNTDRVFHHVVATLLINRDAENTLLGQRINSIVQPPETFEEAFGDYRLHDIELERPGLGSECHCGIITNDFEADLIGYFRDNRVHFTRHNGRARGFWRQINFVKTTTRS